MTAAEMLWVEDDPDHRFLLELGTETTPLAGRYELATDVTSGLAAARAADEAGVPHRLVMVDLKLPDGTGLDLLRALSETDVERTFVVLSSSNLEADEQRSDALGALFFTKPMSLGGWAELGNRIAALLDARADPEPI